MREATEIEQCGAIRCSLCPSAPAKFVNCGKRFLNSILTRTRITACSIQRNGDALRYRLAPQPDNPDRTTLLVGGMAAKEDLDPCFVHEAVACRSQTHADTKIPLNSSCESYARSWIDLVDLVLRWQEVPKRANHSVILEARSDVCDLGHHRLAV